MEFFPENLVTEEEYFVTFSPTGCTALFYTSGRGASFGDGGTRNIVRRGKRGGDRRAEFAYRWSPAKAGRVG